MLHRRKDSTAKEEVQVSSTQTSSQIKEINQIILTSRTRRSSPEGIHSIIIAEQLISQMIWLSIFLPKTGSRGTLRQARHSWTSQQRALRITARQKERSQVPTMPPRPTALQKKKWSWQSYEGCGRKINCEKLILYLNKVRFTSIRLLLFISPDI